MKGLQKDFNVGLIFITHDLGVVANIADRVAVMYAGQIVEEGSVFDIFDNPRGGGEFELWVPLLPYTTKLASVNSGLTLILSPPEISLSDVPDDVHIASTLF